MTVISVATPIVSPSMVSDARSLWARRALRHSAKLSRTASIGAQILPFLYRILQSRAANSQAGRLRTRLRRSPNVSLKNTLPGVCELHPLLFLWAFYRSFRCADDMLRRTSRRLGEGEAHHGGRASRSGSRGEYTGAVVRNVLRQEDRRDFLRSDFCRWTRPCCVGAKKWAAHFRTRLRCVRSSFESESRRAYKFPARLLHQAIHGYGHHAARPRR